MELLYILKILFGKVGAWFQRSYKKDVSVVAEESEVAIVIGGLLCSGVVALCVMLIQKSGLWDMFVSWVVPF